MTGGMAFVYDPEDVFTLKVNPETVSWQRIDHPHWESVLKALVEEQLPRPSRRSARAFSTTGTARSSVSGRWFRRRCCRACRCR